jgi:hypothetical protein
MHGFLHASRERPDTSCTAPWLMRARAVGSHSVTSTKVCKGAKSARRVHAAPSVQRSKRLRSIVGTAGRWTEDGGASRPGLLDPRTHPCKHSVSGARFFTVTQQIPSREVPNLLCSCFAQVVVKYFSPIWEITPERWPPSGRPFPVTSSTRTSCQRHRRVRVAPHTAPGRIRP